MSVRLGGYVLRCWRVVRPRFVPVWCSLSLLFSGFFFPIRDVYAITIPTRQISPGVYGIAPTTAAQFIQAMAGMVGRTSPWITGITLGVEVAKFLIQTADGDITITTAGKAILDNYYTQASNFDAEWCADSCYNAGTASSPLGTYQGSSASAVTAQWKAATEAAAGATCTVTITSETFSGGGFSYSCANGWSGTRLLGRYAICPSAPSGTSLNLWTSLNHWASYAAAQADCQQYQSGEAQGGSKSWSPRPVQMPDGTIQEGWQSPTDPTVTNPNNVTPADTYQYPAINGVHPEATFTPNPDGGYTVQTYSPEFTNPAAPTTQTGWTVQNVTVNNAGSVTNVTITYNNPQGPPTTKPPTTTSGTPPPTTGSGTPQTPPPNIQCGSLNCESTQQGIHTDTTGIHTDTTAIRTELEAAGAPALPDQAAALTAAKAADKGLSDSAAGAITFDTSSWTAWVWTPPAGSCTAPTATLHGGITVSYNYCPFVDNIKSALGWLFAIFASWHIYNVLFRRD